MPNHFAWRIGKSPNKQLPMDVLIFKTNVTTPRQANRLQPLLSALADIKQYNFDLEDCDKVLRIVSSRIEPQTIRYILQVAGFMCEELV